MNGWRLQRTLSKPGAVREHIGVRRIPRLSAVRARVFNNLQAQRERFFDLYLSIDTGRPVTLYTCSGQGDGTVDRRCNPSKFVPWATLLDWNPGRVLLATRPGKYESRKTVLVLRSA